MKRRFSTRQRRILAWVAAGRCAECGQPLEPDFHADHRIPFAHGGPTLIHNGQALCGPCNQRKGAKMPKPQLRPWQQDALHKALTWLVETRRDHRFLINAAPGAGKTRVSCVIAQTLLALGEIDRVIVIAPRAEVVNQWADDFRQVTGRYMSKVTAQDGDIHSLGLDVCATWAAIQGLQDALQALCRAARVLVICDEHHHAAVQAAWGEGADNAFAAAQFTLVLTGTPIRSDGAESVWLPYDDAGAIDYPEAGIYTLTYGQAVDLGYCRPVTFHRHEGRFTIDLDDGQAVQISGQHSAKLPRPLARIPGLQRALAKLNTGKAEALLVVKLDRLTRSVVDLGKLIETYFAPGKAALMSVSEQIDTRSASGRLVLNILASVSQWEREIIAERTSTAMRHKQDKGEYIGGETPYGFKLIDGALIEDDAEQEVIQKAKDFHTAGLSLRKIAAELDKQGIKTRRGSLFVATQVQRMIA